MCGDPARAGAARSGQPPGAAGIPLQGLARTAPADGFPPNGRAVSSRSAPGPDAMLRLLLLLAGLRGCPAPRPGKPRAPPSLGAGRPLSRAPERARLPPTAAASLPVGRPPVEGAASGCRATVRGSHFRKPGQTCALRICVLSALADAACEALNNPVPGKQRRNPGPRDPPTPTVSGCRWSQSHGPGWAGGPGCCGRSCVRAGVPQEVRGGGIDAQTDGRGGVDAREALLSVVSRERPHPQRLRLPWFAAVALCLPVPLF